MLKQRVRPLEDQQDGRYLLCPKDLEQQPAEGKTKGRSLLRSAGVGTEPDALVMLCAFRRRRSFVALRRLLPKYLAMANGSEPTAEQSVEDFLTRCESSGFMIRVEGGYYSIARRIRNDLYFQAQKRTLSEGLVRT